MVALRFKTGEQEMAVAGTVFGGNHLRLVEVDGIEVDASPRGNMLMVRNDDTPGTVGRVGTALGGQKINIARMGLGRRPEGGSALMLIQVDSKVPEAALTEIGKLAGIREVRFLDLG
jgi:D-3-phosphoglycerate dehydrogenase